MVRFGCIPIKINSITVGSMVLQDIKAVRKQPQTIDDLPDGSRNRTAGKPEYTFSLEGALDVDTQILFAAIEEAKATGEVKLTLGDIVEWSPLSSAAEAKVRQKAEASLGSSEVSEVEAFLSFHGVRHPAIVARQTLANAPELAVEYLFRFIAAANQSRTKPAEVGNYRQGSPRSTGQPRQNQPVTGPLPKRPPAEPIRYAPKPKKRHFYDPLD